MSFSPETVIYMKQDTFCTWSHLFPFEEKFYKSTTNESRRGRVRPERSSTSAGDTVNQDQTPSRWEGRPRPQVLLKLLRNEVSATHPPPNHTSSAASAPTNKLIRLSKGRFVEPRPVVDALVDRRLHLVLDFFCFFFWKLRTCC